jgi:hypothetical protein
VINIIMWVRDIGCYTRAAWIWHQAASIADRSISSRVKHAEVGRPAFLTRAFFLPLVVLVFRSTPVHAQALILQQARFIRHRIMASELCPIVRVRFNDSVPDYLGSCPLPAASVSNLTTQVLLLAFIFCMRNHSCCDLGSCR